MEADKCLVWCSRKDIQHIRHTSASGFLTEVGKGRVRMSGRDRSIQSFQ